MTVSYAYMVLLILEDPKALCKAWIHLLHILPQPRLVWWGEVQCDIPPQPTVGREEHPTRG